MNPPGNCFQNAASSVGRTPTLAGHLNAAISSGSCDSYHALMIFFDPSPSAVRWKQD